VAAKLGSEHAIRPAEPQGENGMFDLLGSGADELVLSLHYFFG
jgi:hypothetical protein